MQVVGACYDPLAVVGRSVIVRLMDTGVRRLAMNRYARLNASGLTPGWSGRAGAAAEIQIVPHTHPDRIRVTYAFSSAAGAIGMRVAFSASEPPASSPSAPSFSLRQGPTGYDAPPTWLIRQQRW